MNFKEWFDNKLIVGPFPLLVDREFIPSFNCIINVSDEFYSYIDEALMLHNIKTHWFPMNERKRDIGLNSIYGAMIVLHYAEMKGKNVYLHCHSGRNRSRIVQACYYYMRTGEQLAYGTEKYINRLHRASTRGYLPPMAEIEEFLRKIAKELDNMRGGILDHCKLGVINNF